MVKRFFIVVVFLLGVCGGGHLWGMKESPKFQRIEKKKVKKEQTEDEKLQNILNDIATQITTKKIKDLDIFGQFDEATQILTKINNDINLNPYNMKKFKDLKKNFDNAIKTYQIPQIFTDEIIEEINTALKLIHEKPKAIPTSNIYELLGTRAFIDQLTTWMSVIQAKKALTLNEKYALFRNLNQKRQNANKLYCDFLVDIVKASIVFVAEVQEYSQLLEKNTLYKDRNSNFKPTDEIRLFIANYDLKKEISPYISTKNYKIDFSTNPDNKLPITNRNTEMMYFEIISLNNNRDEIKDINAFPIEFFMEQIEEIKNNYSGWDETIKDVTKDKENEIASILKTIIVNFDKIEKFNNKLTIENKIKKRADFINELISNTMDSSIEISSKLLIIQNILMYLFNNNTWIYNLKLDPNVYIEKLKTTLNLPTLFSKFNGLTNEELKNQLIELGKKFNITEINFQEKIEKPKIEKEPSKPEEIKIEEKIEEKKPTFKKEKKKKVKKEPEEKIEIGEKREEEEIKREEIEPEKEKTEKEKNKIEKEVQEKKKKIESFKKTNKTETQNAKKFFDIVTELLNSRDNFLNNSSVSLPKNGTDPRFVWSCNGSEGISEFIGQDTSKQEEVRKYLSTKDYKIELTINKATQKPDWAGGGTSICFKITNPNPNKDFNPIPPTAILSDFFIKQIKKITDDYTDANEEIAKSIAEEKETMIDKLLETMKLGYYNDKEKDFIKLLITKTMDSSIDFSSKMLIIQHILISLFDYVKGLWKYKIGKEQNNLSTYVKNLKNTPDLQTLFINTLTHLENNDAGRSILAYLEMLKRKPDQIEKKQEIITTFIDTYVKDPKTSLAPLFILLVDFAHFNNISGDQNLQNKLTNLINTFEKDDAKIKEKIKNIQEEKPQEKAKIEEKEEIKIEEKREEEPDPLSTALSLLKAKLLSLAKSLQEG